MITLLTVGIFAAAITLVLTERGDRTIVSICGAAAMVLVGHFAGFFNHEQAIDAIDFDTIGLLFGMMVLVVLLSNTGVFEYLAVRIGQLTKGSPLGLLITLGLLTGVISMFLDNVTTVILIAPVTLQIASLLRLSPLPLLLGEAIISNTLGAATLVGDPPNVIIGTAVGFSFNDFLAHTAPVAFVATAATLLVLTLVFRKDLRAKPYNVPGLLKMRPLNSIRDMPGLRRVSVVIGAVILLFFLHPLTDLAPSVVALVGAAAALAWVRPKVDEVLSKVEWTVLVFFAGLFVMVGGLEHSGALKAVIEPLNSLEGLGTPLLSVSMVWLAATVSALVDNIPFTIAAVPIVEGLSAQYGTGDALWWALALGAGFGGNATPLGSTAGIVAMRMSEKTDTPITMRTWLVAGTLSTIVSLAIASIALFVFNSHFI